MQVGQVLTITGNPDGRFHPHFYAADRYPVENTAYLAADTLSFAPHLKGHGTFDYRDDLVLSRMAGDRCVKRTTTSVRSQVTSSNTA
jgi:hypothetical protein